METDHSGGVMREKSSQKDERRIKMRDWPGSESGREYLI